jgi:hypothetical protein
VFAAGAGRFWAAFDRQNSRRLASLFNPKPQAPAVSGQHSRIETAVACGSGLNEQ